MKKLLAILLGITMLFGMAVTGTAEAATGADVKGTGVPLTVYTNSGNSGRKEWLIERAKQDGFELAVLEEGAGAVQQRIIGEAANPIADVVYGLNAIIWNDLISRDLLVSYDAPSWAAEVSEGLNDPNGYYYAIVKQAIVLAYDKNQVSEEDAPTDWTDLWTNEKFFGKYEASGRLTAGTTRNVIAGILSRYSDPNGELGVSDEGWEAIAAYYQHGVPNEEGVDSYAQIANPNSPVLMCQMWSSGVIQYDEMYGTSTGVVKPEVGIPYAVEGIVIINGTKNMEEALRFVEWFGSAQIQGEWAEKFGTMPANEIAAEKADPFQRELCSIPAQNIDWALVAKNIDAWCEKITLEYLP